MFTFHSRLFFDKIFSKTERKFLAKLRKNRKTEVYEISRWWKVLISVQKATNVAHSVQILLFLGKFSWIYKKFIDFEANFFDKFVKFVFMTLKFEAFVAHGSLNRLFFDKNFPKTEENFSQNWEKIAKLRKLDFWRGIV